MTKEDLEREVEQALYGIFELPAMRTTRCHEIARLLQRELSKSHDGTLLRDGVVSYDVGFLLEQYGSMLSDETASLQGEQLVKTPTNSWTQRMRHSWLEIGDAVVDYHHVIKASPQLEFEQVLIVDSKSKLEGKAIYLPVGREFSVFDNTFIYIPHSVTRLRV